MRELLKLARQAIQSNFENKSVKVSGQIKKNYSAKQACFVTITKNGALRGCIGCIFAHQELYKDVIENAVNSAFNDPRFLPLTRSELQEIKIEVSVLSIPEKLEFKDESDLLKKIDNKMGILLRKQAYSSTFLPQVWEQVPNKQQFLQELSLKAGLGIDDWKQAEIYFYRVERLKE